MKLPSYLIGGILLILMNIVLSAQINNIPDAINKAGQQRMITQRMLKDYILIGMNNTYGNPKEDLSVMIKLFDSNLQELETFIKDSASLESLAKLRTLWISIKKSLSQAPEKEKVLSLQVNLDVLLEKAHKSTVLIVKSSGISNSEIVNISGRQRMLSQRMASLYMLKVWEVNDDKFSLKLTKSMQEFKTAHKKLLASSMNTDEINILLLKSGKAFKFFEMMDKSKSKKYIPSLINRSANKILTNMNTATNLYSSI